MNFLKKSFGVVCFLILSGTVCAQKVVRKYLKKYEGLAMEKAEAHQIPASIILGVSLVESNAGRSAICKSLNNFFGIKGKNANSEKKMGFKSAYKEYKSDKESFEHFCQVLKNKRFYSSLKGNKDYSLWLTKMNNAAYATARQEWVKRIMHTIQKLELYKLDGLKSERATDDLAMTQ